MAFCPESVDSYWSFWLDVADKGIKAFAVIIGAVWTYINVIRSRTYKRKIEPGISGKLFRKNGAFYLLAVCRLKNVGQSKYTIKQEGTYVAAFAISEKGDEERILALEVFKEHGWIEPGEQIQEQRVAPIPSPKTFVALRLALRVVSEGVEWNASGIATENDLQDTDGAPADEGERDEI